MHVYLILLRYAVYVPMQTVLYIYASETGVSVSLYSSVFVQQRERERELGWERDLKGEDGRPIEVLR